MAFEFTKENSIGLFIFFVLTVALVAGTVIFKTTYFEKETSEADTVFYDTSNENVYVTLDGETFDFSDFDQTIRVVKVWASWCPQCAKELIDLNYLGEEFAESGVVTIAINRKENKAQAQSYIRKLGALPHVTFVLDTQDTFYNFVEGYAMPETIFYDASGSMFAHARGTLNLSEMRSILEEMIQSQN